jgi:hypothetical protein
MSLSFEQRLDRTSLVLVVALSAGALIFLSATAAASLAVGGILSTVNFHWLKHGEPKALLESVFLFDMRGDTR